MCHLWTQAVPPVVLEALEPAVVIMFHLSLCVRKTGGSHELTVTEPNYDGLLIASLPQLGLSLKRSISWFIRAEILPIEMCKWLLIRLCILYDDAYRTMLISRTWAMTILSVIEFPFSGDSAVSEILHNSGLEINNLFSRLYCPVACWKY